MIDCAVLYTMTRHVTHILTEDEKRRLMSKQYQISPFGIAIHPWINKPDTKFNSEGVYKVDLKLTGPEGVQLKDRVDQEAQEAFDRYFEAGEGANIKAPDRKKWSVYAPYTEETDDAGNPTGAIIFHFKQNATIKLKDGTEKAIQVGIKDSNSKDMHKPVFGGSELRVMFTFRDIPMKSTKQVGCRMDFSQVQVRKLATSSGPGFGVVDGGYTEGGDASGCEEY